MTGQVYTIADPVTPSMVPIITKIVDRQGETLWEYEAGSKRILTSRVSGLVSEILQKVMENGTGKSAKDAIQLSLEIEEEKLQIPIPAFGKTGTADRFTNSSFIGFILGLRKDSSRLDVQEGYVIATYVGYDDNRPMKGEQVTIYGASGALPLWIDTANAIANSKEFKKDLQVADLAFDFQSIPLIDEPELRPISVSSTSGLPLGPDDALVSEPHVQLLSHIEVKEDTVSLKRVFEPLGGPHYEQRPE
jgi:membrane peptidoglycan carboxypeptidase